jgi:UDP-N-acetylmuramyl pentapeptide phosphotransferase/UDP-N-acetylglucosamine-1-phosphate transferase
VGFLEDIKINIKAHVRLLVLFISSFFVLYYFDIQILRTQVQFINNIIYSNKFLSILFICLCLIFIVNGCNFIDGFNGLLIIHSLIIFIILYFVNFFNNNNLYIDSILFFFIITLISLAYFNFPIAKIFLGDSGAYIIGIFLSFTSIEIANLNEEISPFFFANLLFYIFFEVIFSFFRKIFYEKTSPFKPDSKHLHMLIFQFIKKKNTSSKLNSNFYTSVVINLVYLILILPSLFYYNDYFFCKTYFFILIIIYLFTYFYIEKKLLFKSKKT